MNSIGLDLPEKEIKEKLKEWDKDSKYREGSEGVKWERDSHIFGLGKWDLGTGTGNEKH